MLKKRFVCAMTTALAVLSAFTMAVGFAGEEKTDASGQWRTIFHTSYYNSL